VNIEKIYARLKGFPRPRSAKTITAHQEALAQLYQVLSAFDDMVLHEVNERFLDLYTKKSLPAPVELERLCHQIKREREIRVNATAWQQRQVRKEEQERFNTRYAQQVCHVHGAQAVSEGWQAPIGPSLPAMSVSRTPKRYRPCGKTTGTASSDGAKVER
jgi:hypothetical protein